MNNSVKNKIYFLLATAVLTYVVLKSYSMQGDFDVYLYAAQQLSAKENIYSNNPFNNYLYSPFFALLLKPILIFGFPVARVIWALINVLLTVRLWKLIHGFVKQSLSIKTKLTFYWVLGVIIISAGFWNHNLILGQMTIFILWLTIEGLHNIVNRDKNVLGGLLLGLGIVIKIVPILGLFYLFLKGKFKAIPMTIVVVMAGLIIPSVFIGHNYNVDLLHKWGETINPKHKKYVFEDNNGTVSLNATLPAYFYDFEEAGTRKVTLPRQISSIPHDTLLKVLQILRLMVTASLVILVFYRYKQRDATLKNLYFFWEVSYLMLISILIFPHQQKYVLMYFVPAAAYMILYTLYYFNTKKELSLKYKFIAVTSVVLLFFASIMGRDIVGKYVINIYDHYHVSGLMVLVFLLFLIAVKPNQFKGLID